MDLDWTNLPTLTHASSLSHSPSPAIQRAGGFNLTVLGQPILFFCFIILYIFDHC